MAVSPWAPGQVSLLVAPFMAGLPPQSWILVLGQRGGEVGTARPGPGQCVLKTQLVKGQGTVPSFREPSSAFGSGLSSEAVHGLLCAPGGAGPPASLASWLQS